MPSGTSTGWSRLFGLAAGFALLASSPVHAQLPCASIQTRQRFSRGGPTREIRWERRYRYRRGRIADIEIQRLDPDDGPGSDAYHFHYDRRGLLTEMVVNGRRTVVTRDARGVITSFRWGRNDERWREVRLQWDGDGSPVEPTVDLNTLFVFGWNGTRINDVLTALLQGGREGTAQLVRYSCERARRRAPATCTADPAPQQNEGELRYDASGRLVHSRLVTPRQESTLSVAYERDLPQVRRTRVQLVDGAPRGEPRVTEFRFEFDDTGITNSPTIGPLHRDERGRIVRRGNDTEFRYECRGRRRRR